MKKMLRFVYILIVVMLTAYISSMFTHEGTSTWYQTLKKTGNSSARCSIFNCMEYNLCIDDIISFYDF